MSASREAGEYILKMINRLRRHRQSIVDGHAKAGRAQCTRHSAGQGHDAGAARRELRILSAVYLRPGTREAQSDGRHALGALPGARIYPGAAAAAVVSARSAHFG